MEIRQRSYKILYLPYRRFSADCDRLLWETHLQVCSKYTLLQLWHECVDTVWTYCVLYFYEGIQCLLAWHEKPRVRVMKGIKWLFQIQMRGHILLYYTPCSCTDCCSDGMTMCLMLKRTFCPFQTLFWPLSERGNNFFFKKRQKTKHWSHQNECVFVYLAAESWWGGSGVSWAINSQSHNHISTFY